MQITIPKYSLYFDCCMMGIEDPDLNINYHVVFDGPAGLPGEKNFNAQTKEVICAQIDDMLERGYIPVVAIFEPSNRKATLRNIRALAASNRRVAESSAKGDDRRTCFMNQKPCRPRKSCPLYFNDSRHCI